MVLKLRDAILASPAGNERALTESEMVEMAAAVDLDALDFGEYCKFRKRCYARNTVMLNDFIELVVICWGSHQFSSIHDHGQSNCLYLVTAGTMQEEVYALEDGEAEPVRTEIRSWERGEITVASGPTIHRISNPGEVGLTTVHLYSPPLADKVTNFTPLPTYAE